MSRGLGDVYKRQLPEDDEEYGQESYEEPLSDSDQLETTQDSEISAKEERKR